MTTKMIQESFGFNFSVTAIDDRQYNVVRIVDMWGCFLPVPFRVWDNCINRGIHPMLMASHPGVDPNVLYEDAIRYYCRMYKHTYICYN